MALYHLPPHTRQNMISLISLSNGGEGYGLCNMNVLMNFRNVYRKHQDNVGRLWAVSRRSRICGVGSTGRSEAREKVSAKGVSRGEVEVTKNFEEKKQKRSSSSAADENRSREDINLKGESTTRRTRRTRRTKTETEAEGKLQSVEDFVRELDAKGGVLVAKKLDEVSSSETSTSDDVGYSWETSVNNVAVKSKTKRKPRSKQIRKGGNVLVPESNGRIPSSISPDSSELVRAKINAEEGSSSLANIAQEHYEDLEGVGEKETERNSTGGQKVSSRRKRPGRRERGVLSQEAAESRKHQAEASVPNGRSKGERTEGSPSNRRLSPAGVGNSVDPFDRSHDDSSGGLQNKDKHADTCLDVSLPVKGSSKSYHLDTLVSIPDRIYEQDTVEVISKFLNDKLPSDSVGADSGQGSFSGSKPVEITMENLEESVTPIRKSGAKRRRQRRRKASVEKVSGSGEEVAPVQSETSSDEVLPLEVDDFGLITWCTVHFKVQADLETNQRLCVVGANPELGAWDLSLALPLLKSQDEDNENVWENTIKVPQGMLLEYTYFVEAAGTDLSYMERKFGPEIQHFVPQGESQGTSTEVIKDSWRSEFPVKHHSLSWGSRWWEHIDLSVPDTEIESDSKSGASSQNEDIEGDFSEADTPIKSEALYEERQDVEAGPAVTAEREKSGSQTENVQGVDEWLKRKIRKKVLPREEPWLMESMIMAQRNDSHRKKAEEKEEVKDTVEVAEVEQKKDLPPIQVEILINSPPCTMQRMAILEDGKLVELLLEPVNTRVQVGNVYLGVVRQLLPGMSGVFVDIGGFQLALLDITRNQYPYTYPQLKGVMSNGSVPVTFDYDSTFEEDIPDDEDSSSIDDDDYTVDGDDEPLDIHLGDEELGEDAVDEVDGENDYIVDDSTSLRDRVREIADAHSVVRSDAHSRGPITVNFGRKLKKWRKLEEGMQIIVQVKKEALGKKGPRLTAFPSLAGRFWVLVPRSRIVGVSRRITGPERRRLRGLAMDLQPPNFGLTVRSEALGHDRQELERDLARLLETWKEILDLAASSAVAADIDPDGPVPVLLHMAMGQTLTIVRDFFNTKVHRMIIDSMQCFQEVTSYLQEVAPDLCDRVELYTGAQPIFDAYNVETEIDKFSSKRVSLPNGGYLIVEETEALVSIDVNGGTGMLAQDISQEEAILEVNLAAARQIAIEIRLRDIGGIIVVDFIDMDETSHHKLVYEEMRKATQGDRSTLNLSEISQFGLMEMTRKRVRPSVTLTISEPCLHCHGIGRVQAHETTLSKVERMIRRLLATTKSAQAYPSDSSKWPHYLLRVDPFMGEYLKARKRKRITQLSAALKVWLTLKVALEFSSGYFQVLEQRGPYDRRADGMGQSRTNEESTRAVPVGGLLSKRVWPPKRRRNFGN